MFCNTSTSSSPSPHPPDESFVPQSSSISRLRKKNARNWDKETARDGWMRNQSLAWYEWRAVEYGSVFPAGFLLSQFVLLMFLGAVLLIVHFSVPICRRTFQKQVHTHWFAPSVTALIVPVDAVHLNFDPSIVIMYIFSLKNRYTCTNALGKKTLGTHRDVHAWWVCVRLCLRVTSHSQWTCSLQQSVQVSDNSSCSTHTHTHIHDKGSVIFTGKHIYWIWECWLNKSSFSLQEMMIMLLVFVL